MDRHNIIVGEMAGEDLIELAHVIGGQHSLVVDAVLLLPSQNVLQIDD